MVGRFIGAIVMQRIAAGKVLAFNAIGAVLLLIVVLCSGGYIATVAILAIGLCHSIMFTTIFSLGLADLKQHSIQCSGILCLAIVGGAIIPVIQGFLADMIGVHLAFALPIFCYLFIIYYGVKGHKVTLEK
jgi:FHS family L-fucose permease-like MFS transporter